MVCRVSVCIPTYNGAKYIRRQLESILCQLGENDEVIISDDSSTDGTIDIISAFHDNRIHLFGGNTFHSPIFNMENALKKASGEYIFMADQDDVWLDNKVKDVLPLLNQYELVVTNCKVVNAEESILSESYFQQIHSGKGFWKNLYKNTYIGCCMAFKKRVLDYVIPFPKSIPMHDSWIALNVNFKSGSVYFLDTPCMLYRRHGENASTSSERSQRSFTQKISDRWSLLFHVLKRSISKCTK